MTTMTDSPSETDRPGALHADDGLSRHWLARAEAVAQHRRETGCFPHSQHPDRQVRSLGRWLDAQVYASRRRRGFWTPERGAHLDALLPGWRHRPRGNPDHRGDGLTRKWLAQADATARYTQATGHFPNPRHSDPAVRRLGYWLQGQVAALRNAAGGGKTYWRSTPERTAYLDDVLPGWRNRRTRTSPTTDRSTTLAANARNTA